MLRMTITIFYVPAYPGGQTQEYVWTSSTHVAPLRHLWFRQLLDRLTHSV